LRIEYIEKSNTFEIYTEFSELNKVRSLPNRKFKPSKACWSVPCVRRNIEVLKKWEGTYEATQEVKNIINKDKDINKILMFPSNYVFKTEPRDYQLEAVHKTFSKNVFCLFMEMGLGKTKTSLDVMAASIDKKEIKQILIICPYSIRIVWPEEIDKHFNHKAIVHLSDMSNKSGLNSFNKFMKLKTEDVKVLIVGIESLQRKGNTTYNEVYNFVKNKKTGIVLDEAHNIKNHKAIRTQNVVKIGENAVRKIAMTGTPVSQGISDLYSIFDFLDKDIIGLGDFYSFRNRYCILGGFENKQIIAYKNTDELFDLINNFIYQRSKKDVLKLPDKTYLTRYVELSTTQKKLYISLKNESRYSLSKDEEITVEHILTMYGNLQQILSGFIRKPTGEYKYIGNKSVEMRKTVEIIESHRNPKIIELKKIIDELPEDEPVIVWVKYLYEIDILRKELLYYKTDLFEKSLSVYTADTDDERQNIKNDFTTGKSRYFISTQKRGGTGLTLNNCKYVVYFTNDFSYVSRVQSEDRNHRIGQKNNVTYIDIVYEKTIDKRILTCLKQKKNVADFVKNSLHSIDNIL